MRNLRQRSIELLVQFLPFSTDRGFVLAVARLLVAVALCGVGQREDAGDAAHGWLRYSGVVGMG